MSWTRGHLETMTELQLKIQRLVDEVGITAVGVDNLVETNELLAEAQGYALMEVERVEHKQIARGFAESLRPFAAQESQ